VAQTSLLQKNLNSHPSGLILNEFIRFQNNGNSNQTLKFYTMVVADVEGIS